MTNSDKESITKKERIERATKVHDITKNPCLDEHKISLKCLEENNYDRDKCLKHFRNYRNCTEFWSSVQLDRRRKGIKPFLPSPAERETLKKEYLKQI